MYLGGTLFSDATFKKILSIGYEFETSDLAKLSLHENKRILVNSDLTLRTLKSRTERKTITILDDNYLHIRIPIPKKGQPLVSDEPEITEEEDQETREFMEAMREEYPEEYEKEIQEKKARFEEALAIKENDSYLEYFSENRPGDDKEAIKFHVTNDLGETVFGSMLKPWCAELTIPKNEQFFFKTAKGKLYNFKFSEDIAKNKDCETFSGVEYVITYYKPRKENPDIIIETFVDACSRIIDHLGDLKSTKGTLFMQDDAKTHYTPVGVIENERRLYRKPKTNLFYMDTYDDDNTIRLKSLGEAEFIPQMTFRCKAIDIIDVMKEILKNDSSFKHAKTLIEIMEEEYNDVVLVERITNDIFSKHNETSELKIDMNLEAGKNLKTYVFLIYYKLYMFIKHNNKILSKADYLKDHLSFSSRHPNEELYYRVKEILKEQFHFTTPEQILTLITLSPELKELYEPHSDEEAEKYQEQNYDEEGNPKFNENAYKDELDVLDKNYGNPLFSLKSYFDYLQNKNEDWLKVAKYDIYSTTFDLTGDFVLLENRLFRYSLELYLRNATNITVTKDAISVHDMHKIVSSLYGKKNIRRMITLARHAKKNRLTRKTPKPVAVRPATPVKKIISELVQELQIVPEPIVAEPIAVEPTTGKPKAKTHKLLQPRHSRRMTARRR
jgi:hypothetical protein